MLAPAQCWSTFVRMSPNQTTNSICVLADDTWKIMESTLLA